MLECEKTIVISKKNHLLSKITRSQPGCHCEELLTSENHTHRSNLGATDDYDVVMYSVYSKQLLTLHDVYPIG